WPPGKEAAQAELDWLERAAIPGPEAAPERSAPRDEPTPPWDAPYRYKSPASSVQSPGWALTVANLPPCSRCPETVAGRQTFRPARPGDQSVVANPAAIAHR